jgi:hypothetical protein
MPKKRGFVGDDNDHQHAADTVYRPRHRYLKEVTDDDNEGGHAFGDLGAALGGDNDSDNEMESVLARASGSDIDSEDAGEYRFLSLILIRLT